MLSTPLIVAALLTCVISVPLKSTQEQPTKTLPSESAQVLPTKPKHSESAQEPPTNSLPSKKAQEQLTNTLPSGKVQEQPTKALPSGKVQEKPTKSFPSGKAQEPPQKHKVSVVLVSKPKPSGKSQDLSTKSLPSAQAHNQPKKSSSSGQELQTSSLLYVYAFFRHGIRSPLVEPYPTDPNRDQFHKHFKGPLGQLTVAGKRQMFEVGRRLMEIYGDFVGDYSEEKVLVSSTDKSRTIMTAQSVMASLFPPKKPLLKKLQNWQPIPIWLNYKDFDKVYFYNDPEFPRQAHKQCPRFGEMIQKGYNIVKAKDNNSSRDMIYQLLQQETGRPDVNSIDALYQIYDILEMEKLNGLDLPEWATKPQTALGNRPLYPDLMRPIQVDWFYKAQWLKKDPQMLLFYSGPLFYNINEKIREKIDKNEDNKERFRYHNTHDDTIFTLRWALGFDDPSFEVRAGDGLVFELHQVGGKYFIQVVYYHSTRKSEKFREVLQLKDCPSPCPYDQFSSKYKSLSPKEWEEECKIIP